MNTLVAINGDDERRSSRAYRPGAMNIQNRQKLIGRGEEDAAGHRHRHVGHEGATHHRQDLQLGLAGHVRGDRECLVQRHGEELAQLGGVDPPYDHAELSC